MTAEFSVVIVPLSSMLAWGNPKMDEFRAASATKVKVTILRGRDLRIRPLEGGGPKLDIVLMDREQGLIKFILRHGYIKRITGFK